MEPFTYERAASWSDAVTRAGVPGVAILGGGTDLVPLMREGRTAPDTLVDVRHIAAARRMTWSEAGGVTIGAAVTLRELAEDPRLGEAYPALAMACRSVGSSQLREMGTLGGNLCQRVRCWYFRQGHECLRTGGSHCSAEIGENQYHAIFRTGPCVVTHPSDPAVALVALDAVVQVASTQGEREVPAGEFLATSRQRLDGETTLAAGEVVTAVSLPAASSGGVQFWEKVMQRASWDFALVSLAGVRRRDGEVRLVLGGVANVPWRVTDSIEEDVASGGLGEDDIDTLAQRALYDAEPLSMNAYKVDMAAGLLRRAITYLAH